MTRAKESCLRTGITIVKTLLNSPINFVFSFAIYTLVFENRLRPCSFPTKMHYDPHNMADIPPVNRAPVTRLIEPHELAPFHVWIIRQYIYYCRFSGLYAEKT